jgi:hypothetical protein
VPETLEVHCSRAAISAMVHDQVIPPLGAAFSRCDWPLDADRSRGFYLPRVDGFARPIPNVSGKCALNHLVIAARRAIKVRLRHVTRAANTAVAISIAVKQSFNILCLLAAALAAA